MSREVVAILYCHNPLISLVGLDCQRKLLMRTDVKRREIWEWSDHTPTHKVAEAMDKINDRWGEFVVIPALMMGMGDIILDRISFGGVKELEEIYLD
jgi:hypothetical protein